MLLSEAIELGLEDPNFREERSTWLSHDWDHMNDRSAIYGCAIGAALLGAGFTVADWDAATDSGYASSGVMARLLGIPADVVRELSVQHCSNRIPASELAERVRQDHPSLLVRVAGEAV